MKSPHIIRFLLLAMLLCGLTSCGKKSAQDQAPNQNPNKVVRIADCLNVANIHVLVAEKEGFFKDEGLHTEVTYAAVGKLAMDNLVNGGVDYAGVTEMNVAQMMFTDPNYRVLAEMGESVTGIKVFGRRDKGVIKPSDLRGKKIAVFLGVNIHVICTKLLASEGIPLSAVQLVNLKPADATTAFIGGDVDAIITWEPLISRIKENLGDKAVQLVEDSSKYWTYKMVLVTKASYLQNNEKEAAAVLRALLKADDFIHSHPDVVYDLVAKQLSLDRKKVPDYLAEIHHEIRLTDKLVAMMNEEVKWFPATMQEFKGSKPIIEDSAPLVSGLLGQIRPDRVTLRPAPSKPAGK